MEITAERPGCQLAAAGVVDIGSVAALRSALCAAVDEGDGDLVVDCSALLLADSTGLGALLAVHRRAQRAGRRLVLAAVPPTLARLLWVSRLSRILVVQPTPPAA